MSQEKKRLVILGGGVGGLPLARHIEKDKKLSAAFSVVLVDKKEYFEVNLASPRFLVSPALHNQYAAQYAGFLTTTRFVQGEVRTVRHQPQQEVDVVRPDGGIEVLPYDYLVIALGTRYTFFKAEVPTLALRSAEVTQFGQQLQAARHVLIVGGRSVGVEVLGELLHVIPDKDITIVHPGDSLMDGWPRSGVLKINRYLEKHKNVRVVLRQKVVRSEGTTHELSDGTTVEADIKIQATGVTPNSEALREHFAGVLTAAGFVRTTPTLQVDSFENIFVLGDLADVAGPKMAANIKAQIALVEKNLLAHVQRKKLGAYGSPMMSFPGVVTLGPLYAILALPFFGGSSFGGKSISNLKTDIFVKIIKNPW